MIQSIFVMNSVGDIIIEKHYRGMQTRTICDDFMTEVLEAASPEEVLPVIVTPRKYLCHVQRADLYLLATVEKEFEPLLVLEFLHRCCDVFEQYFGDVNEQAIKDHFVTVYELFDEMMDNGLPFTTEPNVLTKLIPPPSLLKRAKDMVGSSTRDMGLPDGQLSNVPWRKAGVKYSNNEIYFDIVEEVNAIIESNSLTVSSDISGRIESNSRLSGMPDLLLIFGNARILEDVSLHPCVRYQRWDSERLLSFVPPDGEYELCSYRVKHQVAMPFYVNPQITYSGTSGNVNVTVGARSSRDVGGAEVEGMSIVVPFPKQIASATLTCTVGSFDYDERTKTAVWEIGKLPMDKQPCLSGSVILPANADTPESNPDVSVRFTLPNTAASGLSISSLSITTETYQFWKGVRSVTVNGNYQIRCKRFVG